MELVIFLVVFPIAFLLFFWLIKRSVANVNSEPTSEIVREEFTGKRKAVRKHPASTRWIGSALLAFLVFVLGPKLMMQWGYEDYWTIFGVVLVIWFFGFGYLWQLKGGHMWHPDSWEKC